jgi:hypothetical protein
MRNICKADSPRWHFLSSWRSWVSLAVVTVFLATAAHAGDEVKTMLGRLADDLRAGLILEMQVTSMDHTVATSVPVTPDVFDQMSMGSGEMHSLIMSQCNLVLSPANRSSLAQLFAQAAEGASEGKPDSIYWRVSFLDKPNMPLYSLYMGKWYYNDSNISVVFDSHSAAVSKSLVKWFENNVDFETCAMRP